MILLDPGTVPYGISASATHISGRRCFTDLAYDMLVSSRNPVFVNTDIEVFPFPLGAATAGVRRGARKVIKKLGRAAKV